MPGAEWGSSQTGGVPASTGPSVPAADPISSMIQSMVTPISEKDISAAVTPIAGARSMQVPSNFQQSISQHQDYPMNNNPVVGAGNARARGIGNSITAVMNGLGRVVNAEAQHKQNQLKDAATKVITAQQSIDEAQQQLDMAMQSGDTATVSKMKDIIQQNTATRDGIFADPKLRKALQKGFDISYTDPESNKTDEHAAVQAAIKDAKTAAEKKAAVQKLQQERNTKAGAAMGAAFAKQQPQGLAANTTAQAKVNMALQARKDAVEMIKALSPEQVARINQDTKLKTAAMTQATELQKESMQIADRTATRVENYREREKVLSINDQNITQRMYLNNNLILSREKELIKARINDPDNLFRTAEASARDWDARQLAAQSRFDNANTNLANLQSVGKGPGTAEYAHAKALVDQAQDDLEMTQDQADYSLNQYNYALGLVGRSPIPGPGSKRSTGDPDASDDGDGTTTSPIPGSSFTDFLGLGSSDSSIK